MRFGVFIPQGWRMDLAFVPAEQQWATMSRLARMVDGDVGWESVWVYDHFHTTPEPTWDATHEAWTLMAAFAASTSRVRLGQMCTCISYRNPAYLAKVAATVDVVSGGRVNMGIGAGWYEHEWRAYGYGFPPAGERLERLREGVQIFHDMWTTGSCTRNGKHYQIDGARCAPQPLQGTTQPGSSRNGIPLFIAGGGEKKTLRIAAEFADYTNFDGSMEGFRHKSQVLEDHCRDLGRGFDTITRSANYNVFIGATDAEVEDRLRQWEDHLRRAGSSAAKTAELMHGLRGGPLVGTPDKVASTLAALERQGMTYAICYFSGLAYSTEQFELFSREVMPALQS